MFSAKRAVIASLGRRPRIDRSNKKTTSAESAIRFLLRRHGINFDDFMSVIEDPSGEDSIALSTLVGGAIECLGQCSRES